jgi:hypothetical protein
MEHNAFNLIAKPNYKMRPLARIKWWFRKHKYIKERAERGWSRYDAWDFDNYLAMVIGDALEFLANTHMSHPWDYTTEGWSEKLAYISKCFKQYTEDYECPSYEKWARAVKLGEDSSILQDLSAEWRKEEIAQYEEKMKRLKEGFDLLYEVFPNLWD